MNKNELYCLEQRDLIKLIDEGKLIFHSEEDDKCSFCDLGEGLLLSIEHCARLVTINNIRDDILYCPICGRRL